MTAMDGRQKRPRNLTSHWPAIADKRDDATTPTVDLAKTCILDSPYDSCQLPFFLYNDNISNLAQPWKSNDHWHKYADTRVDDQ